MNDRRDDPVTPQSAGQRRRRTRSIAIAISLAVLVVLFYLLTIAKLGPGVLDRSL